MLESLLCRSGDGTMYAIGLAAGVEAEYGVAENFRLTKTLKGASEKTKNSVIQITVGYKFAL